MSPGFLQTIRKLLPFTTIAVVLALLYLGWTFAARYREKHRLETADESKKIESNRQTVEMTGGKGLKILNFYAAPGAINKGQKAKICYGVANAKELRLDPDVERLWPSLARCFEVAPVKDTQFTLTAKDAAGHTATESFLLQVVK